MWYSAPLMSSSFRLRQPYPRAFRPNQLAPKVWWQARSLHEKASRLVNGFIDLRKFNTFPNKGFVILAIYIAVGNQKALRDSSHLHFRWQPTRAS
ncbi:hypothetical protein MIMGU_mgv1a026177mg [Erythranthe guttata]|uniref:Uncharacterized protein n=1 Tax=Erythranthe guttata TaxID=4155 RepID=A0A022Q5G3_ERYGU|nr:hypothetical protein MIMGU_mgv1a026177mg [Erythranthe guttata]